MEKLSKLAPLTAKWRLINTVLFIIFLFLPWMNGCSISVNDTFAESSSSPQLFYGFHMVLLAALFFLQFISDSDADISAAFFWLTFTSFPFLLIVYYLILNTFQFLKPDSLSQWWRWSILLIVILETILVALTFGPGLLIGFWLTVCLVASSLVSEVIEKLATQYSVLLSNSRSPP